ncbi:MAG TPA: hypothetical protein VM053_01690 [Gemmatimonadaceae bacterium]|nr:hypothetical protein [Gemmatimonadaceae bacterium]
MRKYRALVSTIIDEDAVVNRLPNVIPGVLTHQLDGQVVAYDGQHDRVHLLDATTGCVLNLLAEKTWTEEALLPELKERIGVIGTPDLLALAIEELTKAELLQSSSPGLRLNDVSRREAVRRVAAAGIAAALIPSVLTITPSTAYAQASACAGSTNLPSGCSCTGNGNCASGNCSGPTGAKTCV